MLLRHLLGPGTAMTNSHRHHIEGFLGCTITRDRRVFSAFGKELKVTERNGHELVVLGSLKSGNRRQVRLNDIYQRAFGPRTKATMRPEQLRSLERDAAFDAARDDLIISQMTDRLRTTIRGRGSNVRLSHPGAAELLAQIGRLQEFKEWVR